MGTNYYAVKSKPTTSEPIHIGKSSMGWLFLFHEQRDPWADDLIEWHNYDELKKWLYKHTVEEKDYVIINEYDEVISYDKFISFVDAKQNDEHCRNNPDNFMYCRNVNGYRFTDDDFI
jgi:hypothetical protein